jgi:uncharacterized protein (TIGR02246 family)
MTARAVVFACLGALMLAGCGPGGALRAPVDTAKIVDAIKADEVHWNADYRAQDADRVASHYAPDAVAMYPGVAAAVGTAAIRAASQQAFADPRFGVTFESDRVDVAASGDLAAAHGSYSQTATDPKTGAAVTETGSYVTVYKPGPDGIWRAVWDISTPGVAATAPPAAAP